MKLLLDQNLAPSLKQRLADLCSTIAHVVDSDLDESDDLAIWAFASTQNFTIVTKDEDFRLMSMMHGHPPRVVFLKLGNCPLSEVEGVVRMSWHQIERLHDDPNASLLLATRDTAFLLIHKTRNS